MATAVNPGLPFDVNLLSEPNLNLNIVEHCAAKLSNYSGLRPQERIKWLLRAVSVLDLTTLSGDDSFSNVQRLCWKASNPLSRSILCKLKDGHLHDKHLTTAAVCVYPFMVKCAHTTLEAMPTEIPRPHIAAVATGFPSGQYGLQSRVDEIKYAVAQGAREIDIVINRSLALRNAWEEMYNEVRAMRVACDEAARALGPDVVVHMKSILAVGELATYSRVYQASLVCLMAGTDFIKTSTGKETVNATLPVGYVMNLALARYRELTGYKAGFKPAGGIRTTHDALQWLVLMYRMLGEEYTRPHLFRIGASGLLTDLEKSLYAALYGVKPCDLDLDLA